ncbi:DUF2889 domain-containing protein [Yinghuangia sp. ASG 101]|uniref:DUF2889 domain-containing protein n=1 Tax=Yinghuangia sp. ASG 101 TaxID=2896848 RepID=UPI001E30D097|nr:DUF2889 domain-containing protein [Yinghuangia sp. ASG 101]UGQ12790.1 DUF2889 domain-containing protein [Yinghuangia sp. ASG 101]
MTTHPIALHPRRGTHDPLPTSPPRVPGSVRRTASVEAVRPDGLRGRVILTGRGRDLVTGADGVGRVAGSAGFTMEVGYLTSRTVDTITSDPEIPGLDGLRGAVAGPGFRARLNEIAPAERDARSLLYLLLDDVPGAALVSGYAIIAGGERVKAQRVARHPAADQCAGWASDATIMLEINSGGNTPVPTGPVSPPLSDDADPIAWHELPDLPPHGMRRHRRLDVAPSSDGLLTVDQHFRDMHVSGEGRATVLHEYEVHARVEPGTWRVVDIEAVPRVLPWVECPAAVASARRLIGRSLADVRTEVREEFRGTSTCTHLNDQLRSLADVVSIADLMPT